MSATGELGTMLHRPPVPVLMYHSLDRSGSVISTAPHVFRRQVESLAQRGFTGLTLSELLDGWDGRRPLPRRPVALTFDDGLASVLHLAAPILQAVGFRATIFAVPGYCGHSNRWPGQPAHIPRLPVLSWGGLREAIAAGFEIGAHTVTHPPLTMLRPGDAECEIVDSKHMLEDRLGTAVSAFAYPYGLASPVHRRIAGSHFRVAFGTALRLARPRDHRAELPRIDAYYFRSSALAERIGTLTGSLYLGLRRMARSYRSPAARKQPHCSRTVLLQTAGRCA